MFVIEFPTECTCSRCKLVLVTPKTQSIAIVLDTYFLFLILFFCETDSFFLHDSYFGFIIASPLFAFCVRSSCHFVFIEKSHSIHTSNLDIISPQLVFSRILKNGGSSSLPTRPKNIKLNSSFGYFWSYILT